MRKKILAVLAGSTLIGALLLIKNASPTKPLDSLSDEQHVSDTNSKPQRVVGSSSHNVITDVIRHADNSLKYQATIADMRQEFVSLNALRGNLNKREMRRESLANMAKNPQAIMVAERVFLDFDWVKNQFQQDQAIIRVYAIELLKMHAQLGERAPLELATQRLAKKLTSDPNEWQKGREHDLRDLVGAVIEVEGRENILDDVKTFLTRVGYVP